MIDFSKFLLPLGRRLRLDKVPERAVLWSCAAALFLFIIYNLTLAAPWSFPRHALMKVPQGSTLSSVAENLQKKGIIHSVIIFKVVSRLVNGNRGVVAGEYSFSQPQNVFTVAHRLSWGTYDLLPVRVTVKEGTSVAGITQLLSAQLPDFDAEAFYALALPQEGMLFPDTYFFLPGEDADLVLKAFENNFDEHMRDVSLALRISEFGKPFTDVLTMASLLEKEAGDSQNRRIISGILWKRIKLNMPLQVDAVFLYILGKNTFQLTKTDLQTVSLYNTYTNRGLPPGPITNPGVDALLAAVTPITTNYLYYLSDRQGNLHYAVTYEQHLKNKNKYLAY
jgi:UPF0755 protein